MADIFLSYARADQARIVTLVEALETAGYSVWWDRNLLGGQKFSSDIEAALNDAKAVLVAWSKASVDSDWVRDEAESGKSQNKLVPVMLDATLPPMGFRQTHAIDLSEVPLGDSAFASLTSALDAKVGRRPSHTSSEREPNSRIKTAAIAIPAALMLAAIGTYVMKPDLFDGSGAESASEAPATLAILPFSVLGNPDNAYVGQGLAAKLANDLSAFPRLKIIAGTSATAMAAQSLTAREIGERFDIGTIIEGEIQQQGDQIEVRARLVDSATTQLLWSGEVAGAADDLQAIEKELLLNVASALQSRLGITSAPPLQELDVDQAAYDAYLRGLDGINRRGFFDPEGTVKREGYRALTRAVELQPDFADAWAARAYLGLLSSTRGLGLSIEERFDRIESDIDRALQLDSDNRLALASRARLLIDQGGQIDQSIELLEEILETDPDYHPALYHMAIAHISGGDHQEALEWSERLVESDPFNVAQLGLLMIAIWRQNDYPAFKRFIEECELCAGTSRFWAFALTGLASRSEIREDQEAAFAAIRADLPQAYAEHYIATIEAIRDDRKPPQETLDWLLTQNLPELGLATRFGAVDEALANAQAYVEQGQGASDLSLVMVDARISFPAEVRADPRYHALFDNEFGRNMLEYRRRHSIPDGMPISPEEVEAEKARMAAMPFNAGS